MEINLQCLHSLDRSEEERERDKLRHDRHKERERAHRISKAAPDKRFVAQRHFKQSFRLNVIERKCVI